MKIGELKTPKSTSNLDNEALDIQVGCWAKVKEHMKDSSLFIFNKHWQMRQFCMKLVIAPDAAQELSTSTLMQSGEG